MQKGNLLRTPSAERKLKARIVELVLDHKGQGLPRTQFGSSFAYPMGESLRVARNRVSYKPLQQQVDFGALAKLRTQLGRVATDDTAYRHDYDPDRDPLHNHCKAASWVVQQKFGGLILHGKVDGVAHYWNLLPCGTEVDITASQFDPPFKGDGVNPVVPATHIMPLSPSVNGRFLALLQRLDALNHSENK